MIQITADPTGISVAIRVQPRAPGNRIVGEHDGALKVAVSAPPEDGKANDAVVKVLADRLRVPKSAISVRIGATSRRKVIHIDNITAEQFIGRIQQ